MALTPKVTICIPTYNRARYLKEAIQSALAQTFTDFELLVVDNASEDDTHDVVRSFNDKRIRYYRNSKNIGSVGNVKRSVELAEGKYWMTLCDDDFISPNYVECMVGLMEQYPIIMAFGAGSVIDEDGKVLNLRAPRKTYWLEGKEFLKMWRDVDSLPIATPMCMFIPTEELRWWIAPGIFTYSTGDNAAMMTIVLKGNVGLTDKCTYSYRQHQTNEWKIALWQERLGAIKAFLRLKDKEPLRDHWMRLSHKDQKDIWRVFYNFFVDEYLNRIFYIHIQKMNIIEAVTALCSFPIRWRYIRVLSRYAIVYIKSSLVRIAVDTRNNVRHRIQSWMRSS